MIDEITDYTIKGKCSNCGACCGDLVMISKKEIETIKNYIEKNQIKEQPYRFYNGKIILTCPFRDEENKKCTIYPVRPSMCKEFKCNQGSECLGKNKLKHYLRKDYNSAYNNMLSLHEKFYGTLIDEVKKEFENGKR